MFASQKNTLRALLRQRPVRFLLAVLLGSTGLPIQHAAALTTNVFVSEQRSPGCLALFENGICARILVSSNDWPGVARAAGDLRNDLTRVSGINPGPAMESSQDGQNAILIGTIGRSALIDELVREGKLDVNSVVGKWEATVVEVVQNPIPGVASALVIAGSDKRGTIFGIYDLCEQIGVSPWHWWADVPPRHHDQLFVGQGRHILGPSGVKYRGIFINDEGPCLMTWARKKYGELNSGLYTNVFELILRLQGNYLWPAMWDNSFATDDLLSAKLADEYGIVMGTSHHEPMMRAWKEWERAGNPKGSWDYSKNAEKLRAYWAEGIRRTKYYEKVTTLGMRGDGDEPMSQSESIALLERIVADQRKIIADTVHPNITQIPQVWSLYKEVMGYYDKGMRVPDDVILLWCDDNWGNLRRLPTANERQRAGGAGIYYHFDYVGGPRNYKWLNTVPLPAIHEQMDLAWRYGADKLWIANVGDIKPEEVPLEFFLTLGRNPAAWSRDNLQDYLRRWAEREFGAQHATEIADIVAKYAKYNGRRKPELLEPGTFSLDNYEEADRVLAEWKSIVDRAEAISSELPPESRDAFFELVLFPTKASATVNALYIAVAKNRAFASRQDPRANEFARQARDLFQQDAELSDYYNHKLAGGKWNHMMDQTHIGYTGWQQPDKDKLPALMEVTNSVGSDTSSQPQPVHASIPAGLPANWAGFVESDGVVSIEAEHVTGKTDTATARWGVLPDYGRTLSGMTIFPRTAPRSEPLRDSAGLEYQLWLTNTGTVTATLVLSPCLNFEPDKDVQIAVSFDEAEPQVLTVAPKGYNASDGNRDWEESVKDNARKISSKHQIANTGPHKFKIWAVTPAVVVEKIIIDCGGLRPSYLGPPESLRVGANSNSQGRGTSATGAVVSGKYRNLFVEAGHSSKEVEQRIHAAFQQLFHGDLTNETVFFPAGSNANGALAFICDIHSRDVRSEGMSYGMMIAAQLNRKSEFDALWNWAKTYMQHTNPAHPSFGYFSWSLKTNGVANDEMPAPDGEEYFATALYFASARWGNGAGIYNYRAEADRILTDLRHRPSITGQTIKGRQTAVAIFHLEHKLVRFTPDVDNCEHTDPSYHLPAFYEMWARCGPPTDRPFWHEAAAASRDYLCRAAHPTTGLTSEYGNFDGTPWVAPWNPRSGDFVADAWRTAMNWSVDWAWWAADPRQRELSDRLQRFFVSQGVTNYVGRFTLAGKSLGGDHSAGLVAMNATASLATEGPQAWQFVDALWNLPVPAGPYRYYDGMLYMLAMLHCSGEFRLWEPK
jgi:endo-1,4-beta-D-glucanase Y